MRKHKITLFLCFLSFSVIGQIWTRAIQVGGENKEAITVMTSGEGNDLYIGGIFDGNFDWDGTAVSSNGQDDLFLGCLDKDTYEWKWKMTSGSTLDDSWSDLKVDRDGNIICAGVFWVEMDLGDIKLENEVGGKSIFLAKFDPSGQVIWGKSFDGTALKEMRGIDTDADGNIYMTGYFRDQLLLDSITLEAIGGTDAFVAKLDEEGTPLWARAFGGRKDTRGIEIGVMAEGNLALVGYYNDTTYFDSYSLPAKTFDRDIFVSQLDNEGQVLWAKRAGGVFDEEPFDLAIDQEDNIWITGYVVGVLTVEEGFSTQSTNATSDLLLLQYDPNGRPLLAKTFGGTEAVQATSLQLVNDQVVLTGTYQGTVNLSPNLPTAAAQETGFVFTLNQVGQAQWAKSLPGSGQVFSNQIQVDGNSIWVAGTFSTGLDIGDISLTGKGGFDAFIAELKLSPTAVETTRQGPTLKIYPNPVNDTLYLENTQKVTHLRMEDAERKVVFESKTAVTQINLGHLPIGVYFLHYRASGLPKTRVVLIQR